MELGAPLSKHCRQLSRVSKGHGRIETRTLLVSTELNDYLNWPGVQQVFRLERTRWHPRYRGKTRQVIYGLTSLSPQQASPEKLPALIRKYWGMENGLHYRRDVTLREDATRSTVGSAGQNIATLNNRVIGLCLQNGFQNLAKARRLFNAKPECALALITTRKPFL
jgi:predicted transposase YbfD/YdcC